MITRNNMDKKQENIQKTYQSQNHHVVQKTGRVFDTGGKQHHYGQSGKIEIR